MQYKSQEESNMIQQKQIKVKGMHCQSCAEKIEGKLKELNGIEEAKVSFATEQAFVRFNSEKIGLNSIEAKIKEMGYQANVEDKAIDSPQRERLIRIRLEKPSILAVLIAVTLLLTLINAYSTANLRSQLASVIEGIAVESESQTTGTLKEVEPAQPFQEEELQNQPSPQQSPRASVSADNDPVKGLGSAPVTVIEFSDFECPFCARFVEQTLPQIEEKYIRTGKVKLVFRDFPLPFHRNAQKAHQAAECADEQGRFWEYHDLLFKNYRSLDKESLKKYAKNIGLNMTEFNECLNSEKMASEVQEDLNHGSQYGVRGTPTFFINGIELVGAQPYSAFEQIIEQELNRD